MGHSYQRILHTLFLTAGVCLLPRGGQLDLLDYAVERKHIPNLHTSNLTRIP